MNERPALCPACLSAGTRFIACAHPWHDAGLDGPCQCERFPEPCHRRKSPRSDGLPLCATCSLGCMLVTVSHRNEDGSLRAVSDQHAEPFPPLHGFLFSLGMRVTLITSAPEAGTLPENDT